MMKGTPVSMAMNCDGLLRGCISLLDEIVFVGSLNGTFSWMRIATTFLCT